jgi:hypothetical protein
MGSVPRNTYLPGRFLPFDGNDQSPDANEMRTLHQLCEKCTEFRAWLKPVWEREMRGIYKYSTTEKHFFPSFSSMQVTADNGCHFCSILLGGWLLSMEPSRRSEGYNKFSVESSEKGVVVRAHPSGLFGGDLEIYALKVQGFISSTASKANGTQDDGLEHLFTLGVKCRSSHSYCAR